MNTQSKRTLSLHWIRGNVTPIADSKDCLNCLVNFLSLYSHSLFVFPSTCKGGNDSVNRGLLLCEEPSTDRQGRRGWGGRQDPVSTGAPGWAAQTEGPLWGWASHRTSHSWGSPCSYTGCCCFFGPVGRQK